MVNVSHIAKIHQPTLSSLQFHSFLTETDTPTSLKSLFMEYERIDKRNLQLHPFCSLGDSKFRTDNLRVGSGGCYIRPTPFVIWIESKNRFVIWDFFLLHPFCSLDDLKFRTSNLRVGSGGWLSSDQTRFVIWVESKKFFFFLFPNIHFKASRRCKLYKDRSVKLTKKRIFSLFLSYRANKIQEEFYLHYPPFLSPRKLRSMLLGAEKKRKQEGRDDVVEDQELQSATVSLRSHLPEIHDSGCNLENCKDVSVGPENSTSLAVDLLMY
ncbi:hypothetical protein H5410_000508 [Solanum commersonii]|uniref:Uncharacterized protein n=1 Tax=Solanum commersonii TaxID=4109 RepID=A0A9J6AXF0_SOLCO|nr:hypothetical protein H5410_000508 [Solanum commersonii]